MIQRLLISLGRAAIALLGARIVLGLFGSRLTIAFTGAVTALLLARDAWSAVVAERGTRLLPASDPGATVVRRDARIAVPIGLCASFFVGWLFLRA
jgi:hypothetical protein